MAKSSKNLRSLRAPADQAGKPTGASGGRDEDWKTAPSRETTHDDPEGTDQAIEKARKPLENAPGLVPDQEDDGNGQPR